MLKNKDDYKKYFGEIWFKNPSKFWSEAKRLKIKKNIANLLPDYNSLPLGHSLRNFPEGAFGATKITRPEKKEK